MTKRIKILLASPRGFCAGVERAIEIVEKALIKYGPPVYVRHEIVHNKRVVESLRAKGAVFVQELDEIPENSITIFSAHGISESVENEAKGRDLPVIDATCPLVSKVHKEGQFHSSKNREVVLIGHVGHPEVEGTMGRIPGKVHLVSNKDDVSALEISDHIEVAYITQTTLSVDDTRDIIDALKNKFPAIVGPDVKDICYATQNRQQAVYQIIDKIDLLLVVGAQNSSNSNRLKEIGVDNNIASYLIDDATELDPDWLTDISTIGITAGASAPEELVEELLERIEFFAEIDLELVTSNIENVKFKLPQELTSVDIIN
ncbi:4-hydroxy-3-methylbut-2-enyl diphosphate reductase [Rhodospirillales bacterium]|nr:4-hydroxy-3-methylbut-2-enyl diphosphate reductase [Rhodospirillales bacterium]